MRYPQVVVMERDGRLAHLLGGAAAEQRWVTRECRQVEACWRLLQTSGHAVFVLDLGGVSAAELALLARIARALPDVRSLAVGAADTSPVLGGLAWDLGADFVLAPPVSLTILAEVTASLLGVTA